MRAFRVLVFLVKISTGKDSGVSYYWEMDGEDGGYRPTKVSSYARTAPKPLEVEGVVAWLEEDVSWCQMTRQLIESREVVKVR